MLGVRGRDVQDNHGDWHVRLCVSCRDKLSVGERCALRLRLRGGLHGEFERSGLHGVRCRGLQDKHGSGFLHPVCCGELLGGGWEHELCHLHAVPGGELLGDRRGFTVHAVRGGQLLCGSGGVQIGHVHDLCSGELL